MSNVFYGVPLVRRGMMGWATHEASFPNIPILAHIQLSAVVFQNGEQFQAFRSQFARAWIETKNTPTGLLGLPNADVERDNNVWLETDHVRFRLQADGVLTCSAFGLIHDRRAGVSDAALEVKTLDLAIFDDDGLVHGTHRAVQLEGGPPLDADEIQERALTDAIAPPDRTLDVVPVDLSGIPSDAEFRIDVRTRRPVSSPDSPKG